MEALIAAGLLSAAGAAGAGVAAPAAAGALGAGAGGLGAGLGAGAGGLGAGLGAGALGTGAGAAGAGGLVSMAPAFAGALGSGAAGAGGATGLGGLAGSLTGALGSGGAFLPTSTALSAMPSGASLGNAPSGLLNSLVNILPKGKSPLENALLLGQVGSLVGGLLGGDKKGGIGASPLIGNPGGGGGFRPTATGQLEALQQLAAASRRPQGKFFS